MGFGSLCVFARVATRLPYLGVVVEIYHASYAVEELSQVGFNLTPILCAQHAKVETCARDSTPGYVRIVVGLLQLMLHGFVGRGN